MRHSQPILPALLAASVLASTAWADGEFFLKDGDRVVFYGDSITDQRLYTTFTETFVVTRFPHKNIAFVHSGWGGDRVTGGGGGPVDTRLKRDVIAYKPSVVTIMLGMNDASYRAFDEKIFDTYSKGYVHIVDTLQEALPNVRMTLIAPSPYDDVTQPPKFEGGYNGVLVRYGDFVKDLAEKERVGFADLNTSVVAATRKAFEMDPTNATKLNPDRVHPAPGGQLLMAEAILKAWNAPALVSAVAIDASSAKVTQAENTKVSDLSVEKAITWTQEDAALPMPIDTKDSIIALAVKVSDVMQSLNQQTLKVTGAPSAAYRLEIDGASLGTFTKEALAEGVNLATLDTPMMKQARRVHELTLDHTRVHQSRWRDVQVPFQNDDQAKVGKALKALDAIEADLVKDQRAAAQPTPHKFALIPSS